MAIPDTSNTATLFVTRPPAWEMGVQLEQAMNSDVSTSRAGLEQRQQRGGVGRWRLTYQAYLNQSERAAREERAFAEIAAPLIVPFWTEAGTTITTLDFNALQVDRAWTPDFFKVGDWVFFDDGTQTQFRQIEAIGITDQSLELVDLSGQIEFAAGTTIYPCRHCVREQGRAEFESASEATHTERLVYSTL